jgi:hypothetical protein
MICTLLASEAIAPSHYLPRILCYPGHVSPSRYAWTTSYIPARVLDIALYNRYTCSAEGAASHSFISSRYEDDGAII